MRPTCPYEKKRSGFNEYVCPQCGHIVYSQSELASALSHACAKGKASVPGLQEPLYPDKFSTLIATARERYVDDTSRPWSELVQLARHVVLQDLWKGCTERLHSTVTWLLQRDKWPGWWGPKPEVWPHDHRARILHIMTWPIGIGGAPRMMHEWCKRKRDIWDVHVVTCSSRGPWDWTGVTVHESVVHEKLQDRIAAIAADVVVNHTPFEPVTQTITAPQVWIMHGMPFLRRPPPAGVKPACVFSNLDTDEIHPAWKASNWNVLPVGIDLSEFCP